MPASYTLAIKAFEDIQSFDDLEGPATPLTQSGRTSPASVVEVPNNPNISRNRKKKKKKGKKSTPTSESPISTNPNSAQPTSVLRISRNKHWKYISSYNGDWPSLQVEALEDLYALHHDKQTVEIAQSILHLHNNHAKRRKTPETTGVSDLTPPDSPHRLCANLPYMQLPSILQKPFPSAPPAIDRHIFHSLIQIRRLVDEASELSVRASSGMSSVELGSLPSNGGVYGGMWGAAHALSMNPMGRPNKGGRNVTMSANRIHRLRALAVQKLAQAYRADEIASSVMIMQGGDVFDDIAERVLKVTPNDSDARYVQFFHEKIPSRHLSQTTTTCVLDELISAHPQRLEYYRTRGVVQCFRDEFPQAIKDFTHALKDLRATRKSMTVHSERLSQTEPRTGKATQVRKGKSARQTDRDYLSDATPNNHLLSSPIIDEKFLNPLEPQVLFFRGTAYLLQAVFLIEAAILRLEGVTKKKSSEVPDLRLSSLPNSKYGGVEVDNPEGPLGDQHGAKRQAYTSLLSDASFRGYITSLLKKCMRDHEKFIKHFDSVENPDMPAPTHETEDIPQQIQEALRLSEFYREKRPLELVSIRTTPVTIATTYHPLLVESYFTILLCYLMLGDFTTTLPVFIRTATVVNGLDPSPIFAPARSVAQAEFTEVLERLSRSWRNGTQPYSRLAQRGKGRLAIEAPSPRSQSSKSILPSPPASRSNSCHEADNEQGAGSSSAQSNVIQDNCQFQNSILFNLSSSSSLPVEEPSVQHRPDAAQALDSARILLTAVTRHRRRRAEDAAAGRARTTKGGNATALPINLPLHGPRVDVILAWLAAVHLPELDQGL
ncbi:hypothetical protein CPB83DRAFT_842039 [Crepidotus variabilis]|uniref:Uncharacterized protein n=1 Tax=Crepidotus variabilis TaxID=179855 RepID=A0A9P6EVD5_9AGAR|nr:hypothetical protein CPB83DRAFT_842039 [Crepidotus variabilis]